MLEHSFVESPERKNVYDGVAVANDQGEVEVRLPSYFEALNRDFRYQLTAMGGPAPNLHVRRTVDAGAFSIAGAGAGQSISWQVTGIRKDALSEQTPLVVERDKAPEDQGLYLHPLAFGEPISKRLRGRNVPPPPTRLERPQGEPPRPPAV